MSDAEDVDAQEQFFFESKSTHASAHKNEDELGDEPVDSKSSGRASVTPEEEQPPHLPEAKAPSRSNSELFADLNNMGTEQPAPQKENISGESEGPRDKEADEAYVGAEPRQFEDTPNFFDSKHDESDGHPAPHAGENIAVYASTTDELPHISSPEEHSAIQTIHQEYEVEVEELEVRGTDAKEEVHEPDAIDHGRSHGGEDGDFVAIFNSEDGGGGHGHAEEKAIDCPDPEPAPPIVEEDNPEVSRHHSEEAIHTTNDPTGVKEAVESHKSEASSDSYHNFFSQDGEEGAGEGDGEVVAPPKQEEEVHPHLLDLPLSPELRIGNEDAATGIDEQANSVPTTENDDQQPPLAVEPVVMPLAPMSGSGELVESGPLDDSNENCSDEGVHKSSGAVIALPVGDVPDQRLDPSEKDQSPTEPLLRANEATARVGVVGQAPAFSAARRRRDHLFSHVPDERDVVRGLVPNPAACYGEADPADIDLEAADAARNKHATFVRNLRLRRIDTKDYVHSIRDAVGRERVDKQTRSQYKSGWSAQMLQRRAEESKGLFSPLGFDSDSESDYEEGNGEDGSWFRNPMKKFKEAFGNLCCFGNRICCHFNVLPLGVELTHDNCRSPLLCAIIFLLVTVWFVGGYSFGLRDDVKSTTIGSIEPFVPLLCFFMTVSGSGAIPYLIGLAASSFCVYRASVELCDDDNQWTKTMYTHLVLALAVMQLCIVAFIGLGLISRLGRMWCADCLQSVFGSVDGEDEALERFLYSRRLINWRPPLSTAHWKAKLQRAELDPGKYNRYSVAKRLLNTVVDVPIRLLQIPVKLTWALPPQCPDIDTRPVDPIPVIYSIGLSIISLLVAAGISLLIMALGDLRDDLVRFDAKYGTSVSKYFNQCIGIAVTAILAAMLIVIIVQLVSFLQVVRNVRKGGCNGSMNPQRKIEQLRDAAPYRVLDAVSLMFFTFCVLLGLSTLVIVVGTLSVFALVEASDTKTIDETLKTVFSAIGFFIINNLIVYVAQWLMFSRFLMDSTNLRHPRLFSLFSPLIIVASLSTNFARTVLSFAKSLISIPLMFVLPMSYPTSPLHNPLMAIIFFNEEANNSLKSIMTAYFQARSQMQKVVFLGENYGIRSRSFKITLGQNIEPPLMHASVDVEPNLEEAKLSVAQYNDLTPKTKLIYVSLKAFGEAELYQSQRHLVRLWVLLDYFPERFPRSLTPSASLHPSLERVIFEELLEYVSWVLEPRQTTLEAQILDKSPHYHYHLERDVNSNISPAIRDLWRTTVPNEYARRVYKKTIVTSIMVAHGLIVTEDSLRGVGDDTAARMVAVTSPRPYCHLSDVNAFRSVATRAKGDQHHNELEYCDNSVARALAIDEERDLKRPYEVVLKASALSNTREIDDENAHNSIRMLTQSDHPRPKRRHPSARPAPSGGVSVQETSPLVYKTHGEKDKLQQARSRLRKATAAMYRRALTDFYELLEVQHVTRMSHLKAAEKAKKAWLINALEHPDSILIPVRVWGAAEGLSPNVDYVLPGPTCASNEDAPHSSSAVKGRLLSGCFVASISPKGPKSVARDRACWRWRLALTLMLYPELRRDRKHYLRLNGFTPAKPISFDPTGF